MPERVIPSRLIRFWPWLVASAAIHGLFLLVWLNPTAHDPATASSQAGDVAIELVSIELQPGKQVTPAPASKLASKLDSKLSSSKKQMPETADNRPASRQTLTMASDSPASETSKQIVSAPSNSVEENPGPVVLTESPALREQPVLSESPALSEQPASSVQKITAKQTSVHDSKPQVDAGEMDRIRMLVRSHLETFKYYPASARRRGIEGHVEVGFTLTRGGAADRVSVLHGSGYAMLDHAALATVHRAEPFPVENGKYRFSLRFKRL